MFPLILLNIFDLWDDIQTKLWILPVSDTFSMLFAQIICFLFYL